MNLLEQLQRPVPERKIRWRVGHTNWKKIKGAKSARDATQGLALPYIDARDVINRLNDVVGADNWQCRYPMAAGSLLICEIGIRINDVYDADTGIHSGGEWIWKANGAGDTQVEAEKGKCSDSFKRAAICWGIGQYLWYLPNAWVQIDNGKILIPPPVPVLAATPPWISTLPAFPPPSRSAPLGSRA